MLTSFNDVLTIKAYLLRVSFIYQMKQRNVIITVGDDEDFTPIIRCVLQPHTTITYSPYPLYRVWNYEKITKEGTPTLARTIPAVIPNSRQSAVRRLSPLSGGGTVTFRR